MNGEDCTLPDGATVLDAVHATGAEGDARGVAVAVDGEVLPRGGVGQHARWREGCHVEVLHAVQGGC